MSIDKMVFEIKNFERDHFAIGLEKVQYLSFTILAMSDGKATKLREMAEEMDIKKVLLEEASKLSLTNQAKFKLNDYLDEALQEMSFGELTDYIMLHAETLELYTDVELANSMIQFSANASKTTISVPKQVTEIVSTFFGDYANNSVHVFSNGIGMEVIDLYKKNPSAEFHIQQLDLDGGLMTELFFCINNANIDIRYGDLISQPAFIEDNHLQKFNFVYAIPPFGAKAIAQQEKIIESDGYNRFNYYGKPSKSHLDLGYLVSEINALSDEGKAAFLLPVGALFRSGMDQKIRERLLYSDVVEAIIELPAGLLSPYTGISTALILVNKNKVPKLKSKIIMMNLSDFGESERRKSKLSTTALDIIKQGIREFVEVSSVSKVMSNSEFKDMNLLPSNYLYEAKMEFEDFGTVQFDLNAFKQLDTKPLNILAKTYRGYNALPRNLNENGAYAVLKIADIEYGEINYEGLSYYNMEQRAKVDNYRIQKGDVILSIRGQSLKVAIFDSERDDVLLSQNFVGIRCEHNLDPQFLKLYFESPTVQFIFRSKLTGSTVMNLPIKEVESLNIPLLPLNKQQEIVQTYMLEKQRLQEQLRELKNQLKQLKLDSFKAMGIAETYTIQD